MNTYPVLENEHLTEDTFRLRCERPDIAIKSGQCFNIGLPGLGVNREYSIYSSANSPYLDFLIRSVEGGLISLNLQKTKPGDLVEIDGAYGDFCIEEPIDKETEYLFIATGTGIAPFHSFVETWPDLNYNLVHGVRFEKECYHIKDYEKNSYVSCISRPSDKSQGMRVTDYLLINELPKNVQVYICGNKNMIIDVFELLHSKGIYGNQIKTEVFF